MTFISYAQNYEDVMLWRALKHLENGFYIDVGAAWPDEHSITKAFYIKGWHGINIEPNPLHYASLMQQRGRDINLQLAIGERSTQMIMNFIGFTGLSTLDINIAKQHQKDGWVIEQQQVSVEPLWVVCQLHVAIGQDIHFLKIDVEGFEKSVLNSNDWIRFRPWIVLVEATLPLTQTESYEDWEPILLNAAYTFAYADGLNRFYVANEHTELLAAFKYPPNFFDGFLLSSQQEAETKAQQAETKAQQAETKAQQAETVSALYIAQLQAVYASKSWRVTAPLRWVLIQAKLLCTEGPKSRIKTFIKKALRKINYELLKRPVLLQRVIRMCRKIGLYKWLRAIHEKLQFQNEKSQQELTLKKYYDSNQKVLSVKVLNVYKDLKKALSNQLESN